MRTPKQRSMSSFNADQFNPLSKRGRCAREIGATFWFELFRTTNLPIANIAVNTGKLLAPTKVAETNPTITNTNV